METTMPARIVGGFKALLRQISRFIGGKKVDQSHEIAKDDHLHQGGGLESLSHLLEPEKEMPSTAKTASEEVTEEKIAEKKKKTSVKKKTKKKAATKKSVKKKATTKKRVANKKV